MPRGVVSARPMSRRICDGNAGTGDNRRRNDWPKAERVAPAVLAEDRREGAEGDGRHEPRADDGVLGGCDENVVRRVGEWGEVGECRREERQENGESEGGDRSHEEHRGKPSGTPVRGATPHGRHHEDEEDERKAEDDDTGHDEAVVDLVDRNRHPPVPEKPRAALPVCRDDVLVDVEELLEPGLGQKRTELEDHRPEPQGDEDEEEVAEEGDVAEEDDDDEGQRGEQKHLVVGQAKAEDEGREPENLVGGLAHPPVGEQHHEHQEEGAERIDLDDGRLRPHHGREGENEAPRHAAGPAGQAFPGGVVVADGVVGRADHVRGGPRDEHRRAAGRQRAEDGRGERDAPRGRRLPAESHEAEGPREDVGNHRPDRVARRMRDAEMVARDGELARILERHARAEREEIDDERDGRRRPERSPVNAPEEWLARGAGCEGGFGIVHGGVLF